MSPSPTPKPQNGQVKAVTATGASTASIHGTSPLLGTVQGGGIAATYVGRLVVELWEVPAGSSSGSSDGLQFLVTPADSMSAVRAILEAMLPKLQNRLNSLPAS